MKDFLLSLLPSTEGVVVTGFAALVAVLVAYLAKKIANETLRAIVTRALNEIRDVVLEVYQTYVKALKEAAVDGKLLDAEKDEAMAMAIARFKENFGFKGLKRLAAVLGLDMPALDKWITGKIEATLADVKASSPVKLSAFEHQKTPTKAPDPSDLEAGGSTVPFDRKPTSSGL